MNKTLKNKIESLLRSFGVTSSDFSTSAKGPDLTKVSWNSGESFIHLKREGEEWIQVGSLNQEVVFSYRETGTGTVFIAEAIDFEIPRPYDVVSIFGFKITVAEELRPRISFEFDEDAKVYRGSPLYSDEPTPRLVFNFKATDGGIYSWRSGEHFEKKASA